MNQSKPTLFLMVIQGEENWIAIGSDKIDLFEFTASREEELEFAILSHPYKSVFPTLNKYVINGRTRTLASATGSSPLSAIGALIDFMRDQEAEETIRKEKRKADLERFGGEVNEELIRKVVRWRKKQEKKRQQEAEWDPYNEWEF